MYKKNKLRNKPSNRYNLKLNSKVLQSQSLLVKHKRKLSQSKNKHSFKNKHRYKNNHKSMNNHRYKNSHRYRSSHRCKSRNKCNNNKKCMTCKNSSNAKVKQNKKMNSSILKRSRCKRISNKISKIKKKQIHAMTFQVKMILKHTELCLSFLTEIGVDLSILTTWQLFLSNSIKIHPRVSDND